MKKDIFYPLRRLHGQLHENASLRRRLKNCRVLVPGTPEHGNLGDSAIVLAQMAFLERCGLSPEQIGEVTFSEYPAFCRKIRRFLPKNVLITQLGGGNMGSQWKQEEALHRRLVVDFPRNPMVIFPQTIYYAPDAAAEAEASKAIYGGHKKLTMVAREQPSAEIMASLYPDIHLLLTPDIVLSSTIDTFSAKPQKRQGILLCMRSDAERSMSDEERDAVEQAAISAGETFRYTDMCTTCRVTPENRKELVRQKMEELASAQLIVTDRLHGMILAAVTGTPCIVFSNYNHKVRGAYQWIKYLPYIRYAESTEQALQWIPELLAMGEQTFDNNPLQPYFYKLAQVVKEYYAPN